MRLAGWTVIACLLGGMHGVTGQQKLNLLEDLDVNRLRDLLRKGAEVGEAERPPGVHSFGGAPGSFRGGGFRERREPEGSVPDDGRRYGLRGV